MSRAQGGGVRVAGPDVRKLGDILYAEGARVSGDPTQITVADRTGEQVGRLVAQHQLVISELSPVGASLEDVVLPTHRRRRGRRAVMTHVINSELFKLRTTRTFFALVGVSLAIALLASIRIAAFVNFNAKTWRTRSCRSSSARSCAHRARDRHPGRDERVPPRHDHADAAGRAQPDEADAGQARGRAGPRAPLGFLVGLIMVACSAMFGSLRDFDTGGMVLSIVLGSTLPPRSTRRWASGSACSCATRWVRSSAS